MQAYVHELAQCLVVQLDDEKATSGLMKERMLILSVEGMRLIGRRLLQNPAAHKALITGNMAQGQRTLLHLDAGFYAHLMASKYDSLCSFASVAVLASATHTYLRICDPALPCPALPCPALPCPCPAPALPHNTISAYPLTNMAPF